MKTNLRYLSLNAQVAWHRQVEKQLAHLHRLTEMTAADVTLEHQRDVNPSYRVQIQLQLPGPRLHARVTRPAHRGARPVHGPGLGAEARDNTLAAALLKATKDLEHQVQACQLRRAARCKSKLQLSAFYSRWTNPPQARRRT